MTSNIIEYTIAAVLVIGIAFFAYWIIDTGPRALEPIRVTLKMSRGA